MAAPRADHGQVANWSASIYNTVQKIRVSQPMLITGVSGQPPSGVSSVTWAPRLYNSSGTLLAGGAGVFRNVAELTYCVEVPFTTPYLLQPGVDYYAGLYGHYLGYRGGGLEIGTHDHTDGGVAVTLLGGSDAVRWGPAGSDVFGSSTSGIYEMAFQFHLVDPALSRIARPEVVTPMGFGNQRVIDHCSNGVQWMWWTDTGGSGAPHRMQYSTDGGATWAEDVGSRLTFAGISNGTIFIDSGDNIHHVYKNGADGFIYYRRGTPNIGRTAWTWSAAHLYYNGDARMDYPDVVAFSDGASGWHVIIAASYVTGDNRGQADQGRFLVGWDGTITLVGRAGISAIYSAPAIHQWPSLDFHHTGDGKTVKGGLPHLYMSWSGGNSANGIRFRKAVATSAAGGWSWNPERTIDTGRYIGNNAMYLNCMYDSANDIVVMGGYLLNASSQGALMLYERDQADATTVVRSLVEPATGAPLPDQFNYGQTTMDTEGDVVFAAKSNQTEHAISFRKWHRKGWYLGPAENIEAGVNVGQYEAWTRLRSFPTPHEVDVVCRLGTGAPFSLFHERLDLRPWIEGPIEYTSAGVATIPTTPTTFAAEVMADSPVGYWKLDETSGTFANSAGGQVGTAVGSFYRGGMKGAVDGGNGVSFQGVSGAGITIPADPALNVVGGLTIEAWVWVPTWEQSGFIFEKTTSGSVNTQYSLFIASGTNRIIFRTVVGGTITADLIVGGEWPTREWVHVVGTWNGSTKRLYVNGVDIGSIAFSGTLATGAGGAVIGAYGNPPASYWFNGLIDDVAVYPTALSAQRVLDHYRAGRAVSLLPGKTYEYEVQGSYHGSRFDTWSDWSEASTFDSSLLHERTADDLVPVSDEASQFKTTGRGASDSSPVVDAATRWVAVSREGVDSAPATDIAARYIDLIRTTSDSTTISDVAIRYASRARAAADSLAGISDGAQRYFEAQRASIDGAAAADVASRYTERARAGTESLVAPGDVPVRVLLSARSADDDISGGSDSAERTIFAERSTSDVVAPGRHYTGGLVQPLPKPVFRTWVDREDYASSHLVSIRETVDSASAIDEATRAVDLTREIVDGAPAIDDATRSSTWVRVTADIAPASDSAIRTYPALARQASDSTGATDEAIRWVDRVREAIDAAPTSEGAERALQAVRSALDDAYATDVVLSTTIQARGPVDEAPATDQVTHARALFRYVEDEAPVSDNVGALYSRTAEDTASVIDSVVGIITRLREIADSAPATDGATRALVLPRQADDLPPQVTDQPTSSIIADRDGLDVIGPPVDSAIRILALLRQGSDEAPTVDGATLLHTIFRETFQRAGAVDAVIRILHLARQTSDGAPATDALSSTPLRTRVSTDSAEVSTDVVTRLLDLTRTTTDVATVSTDVATSTRFWTRSVDDITTTVDLATRRLYLPRRATEALPSTSDAATRWTLLFRTTPDRAGALDQVIRTLSLRRLGLDVASATDEVASPLLRHRHAQDDAPVSDSISTLQVLARIVHDLAPAHDLTHAVSLLRRGVADLAPAVDQADGSTRLTRGAHDLLVTLDAASSLIVARLRWGIESLAPVIDFARALVRHVGPLHGPPVVTILDVSRTRIGWRDTCNAAIVEFTFDRPVDAWTVRVNSNTYADGTEVSWWEGDPTFAGSAVVSWDDLLQGVNEVKVYARSGGWSL